MTESIAVFCNLAYAKQKEKCKCICRRSSDLNDVISNLTAEEIELTTHMAIREVNPTDKISENFVFVVLIQT